MLHHRSLLLTLLEVSRALRLWWWALLWLLLHQICLSLRLQTLVS